MNHDQTTPPLTRGFRVLLALLGVTVAVMVLTPASDWVADHWWALGLFVAWCAGLAVAAWRTAPHVDLDPWDRADL